MSDVSYKTIIMDGLWKNNVGVVALLGLCPLLAVSTTLVNGTGLVLATAFVMSLSNGVASLTRNVIPNEIRIPAFILIIAVLVTMTELLMHAYVPELFHVLGIYIPLIVANCAVLGRVEAFAAKNRLLPSMVDGFIVGFGLTLVLGTLGGMRELFGKGTLLSGIDMALGEWAKTLVIHVIPNYEGFLVAVLPPGAFLGLGMLVALKKYLDIRGSKPAVVQPPVSRPQPQTAST